MLESDPQVFLAKLAAKILAGEITEDEGRAQWGDYNTARAKAALKRTIERDERIIARAKLDG